MGFINCAANFYLLLPHTPGLPAASAAWYLDYLHVMTYDFHGTWERQTGENSPLYKGPADQGAMTDFNVNYAMNYWKSSGAPAEKLLVGFPTYGHTWTLANPSNNGVGAPATGAGPAGPFTSQAGFWAYYEICTFISQGATQAWDAPQDVPYAYKDNLWVGYDNEKSFIIKPSSLYADPEDLTGFYRCEKELTFYFTCHEGMVFDQKVLNCVVPPAASSPALTLSETTTTPKLYNSNFCVNKPSLLYADPEDLTGFYRCENELTFYFTCHEGMVFDQKVLNCVVPPALPSPGFCILKPNGIYRDLGNRAGFYVCVKRRPFYKTCPTPLVFNPELLICDNLSGTHS
ncbi:UNVERIFIED_CONTAM: hypothetical protein FKN15_049893 [Acipenser sinensis]